MTVWHLFFWAALTAAFLVTEAYTAQLLTVWFGVGSLLGLLAALAGAPFYLQAVVFLLASAVSLGVGLPFVRRFLNRKKQKKAREAQNGPL